MSLLGDVGVDGLSAGGCVRTAGCCRGAAGVSVGEGTTSVGVLSPSIGLTGAAAAGLSVTGCFVAVGGVCVGFSIGC